MSSQVETPAGLCSAGGCTRVGAAILAEYNAACEPLKLAASLANRRVPYCYNDRQALMSIAKRQLKGLLSYENPLLGIVLPLLAYLYLRYLNPAADLHLAHPANHFRIVSATSLIALGVAIAVGIAGLRQRNLQVLYVALAFISLAGIFSVHGLATPGFILEPNAVVGVASQLAVMTTGLWLLVSALPSTHPLNTWLGRRPGVLLIVYSLLVITLGIWALSDPSIVAWVPVNQAPLQAFATVLTIGMALAAGLRYWRSYRYSRFPFQLAVAYTCGWIAVSQFIITTGATFYLSWWIYHGLLLLCVVACVLGLARQYRRSGSPMLALQGLFSADPAEQLEAGISDSVRNLILATERRDPYTAGHQYRVAQGAFKMGRALRLRPEQLRALVQGGVVHDVGKINVPDEVLNKRGPLTAAERAAIERHTIDGFQMCARLGFMGEELTVIRSHHEHFDGRGYPDGLSGEQIPLLARIMAVSDVYDALTSSRAYRDAWSQADALDYLQKNRGRQFEPRMVDLWLQLVESGEVGAAK